MYRMFEKSKTDTYTNWLTHKAISLKKNDFVKCFLYAKKYVLAQKHAKTKTTKQYILYVFD